MRWHGDYPPFHRTIPRRPVTDDVVTELIRRSPTLRSSAKCAAARSAGTSSTELLPTDGDLATFARGSEAISSNPSTPVHDAPPNHTEVRFENLVRDLPHASGK